MIPKLSPLHFWRLFSLRNDQASPEVIDATIRGSTQLAGTNLWVLMFAIVIASVGLNVNSTAIIIGAMLISPLMGPIIGIGYGVSINDYLLIKSSLRNLAVFVSISLFASTIYFLLSPLTQAHSELLARTSPSIWDVLIAFFGGAAGMIGLTRKEKTTLIPGVAIATALMPPICTAGYGIATGQPTFFLGAFYLFLINGVFIAFATLAIARILRLPQHNFLDEVGRRRGRLIIGTAVGLTLLPSIYLAYQLVQEEIFATAANRFVTGVAESQPDAMILAREIDAKQRAINLTMMGTGVTPEFSASLEARLAEAGLAGAQLTIRHASEARVDLDLPRLKRELQQDVLRNALTTNEAKASRIATLEAKLAALNTTIEDLSRVEDEIRAQLPKARHVMVDGASNHQKDGASKHVLVVIDNPGGLNKTESARLKRWLAVRMPDSEIDLVTGKIQR
jgi:uncharacterized hydrophobic protein (TIGR00271 family)